MVRYTNRALMPGEHVVYIAGLHWTIYRSGLAIFLFAVLLGNYGYDIAQIILKTQLPAFVHLLVSAAVIATAAMGLFDIIFTFFRHISTELVVTNHRLIIKYGFFGAQIYQTLLAKITGVDIEQTTFGRLEDYGTINVMATASHIPPVDHVADPFRLQSMIMRYNAHQILEVVPTERRTHPAISHNRVPRLEDSSGKQDNSL